MDRYVCPPWFECRCVLGKPVSKSTMISHRRAANTKRAGLGLPLFGWVPKVEPGTDLYVFECVDSLIDHQSDCEQQAVNTTSISDPAESSWQREIVTSTYSRSNSDEGGESGSDQITGNEMGYIEPIAETPDAVEAVERVPSFSSLPQAQESRSSPQFRSNALATNSYGRSSNPRNSITSNDASDGEVDSMAGESGDASGVSESGSEGGDVGGVAGDVDHSLSETDVVQLQSVRLADLLPWLFQNQRWVNLANKHGLDEVVMDEILDIIQAPCKQWKTITSNVCKAAGLQNEVETYPMCPGHMAFVPDPETGLVPDCCSECGNSMPSNGARDYVYEYLPLIPRLRKSVASSDELYTYRRARESDQSILRDYFDGHSYRLLCYKYGGEEKLSDDIFVLVSTDGFTPFKNRKYDMWTVAAITFNLPPDQRYLPQNVLQLSFVPGPRQPKNLQSFLLPLVNELKQAADGITMKFQDGSYRSVRVHLICFTGDQPAVCKISGLVGPNGRTPCRDCEVQGCYYGHYYFPSKIETTATKTRILFNPRDLPTRSIQASLDTISEVESASGGNRRDLQLNSGIRESSVLFSLPTILPYVSFPHDVMHTFYNVQVELLRIMLGSYKDDFSINKSQLDSLDAELKDWKWGIASQLGPQPMCLSKYKDWKAADHKRFSIMYSLVVFDGVLPTTYLNGLQLFSELVDICTRGEVSRDDVDRVQSISIKFYEHYERSYFKYREDRVDLCKSVFHILLHLSDCLRNYGPLIGISQYWIEGHIGWIGRRNSSRNRPAQSMFKNASFRESLKPFYEREAFQKTSDMENVVENGGYILTGAANMFSLAALPDKGRQIRGLIADYLCRKYDLTDAQAKEAVSDLTAVSFHPRVKFVACCETQTSAAYLALGKRHRKETRNRPSCYIAVEMEKEISESDDVWYGRLLRLISFDLSFADTEPWGIQHEVAMMDWARTLFKGPQGQIYANGRINSAFSGATIEDISVIKRLVGIVEHTVPGLQGAGNRRGSRRSHLRSYFLDDAVRIDHLLSSTKVSLDGKNRILKGFQR